VVKVQSLEVSNAKSSTLFRRHNPLLGVEESFLVFANDDETNQWSFTPVPLNPKHAKVAS
jgi:hypothetical protein